MHDGNIAAILMACVVVGVWSRTLPAAVAALLVLIGLASLLPMHCFCGYRVLVDRWPRDPYQLQEACVIALLCLTSWSWRRRRPKPRPRLRALAIQAAVVTVCGIAGGDVAYWPLAMTGGTVLAACLYLEERLDQPALPTATARSAAPPPDRTGCGAGVPRCQGP